MSEVTDPVDLADLLQRMSYSDMRDFADGIAEAVAAYAQDQAESDEHRAAVQACTKVLDTDYFATLLLEWAAETLAIEPNGEDDA